jgi:hypothetical protein
MYKRWRDTFWQTVQQSEYANALKQASLTENLSDWTKLLTGAVIETCEAMGWKASAKGHKLSMLPVARCEYLAMDVMGFADGDKQWRFPAIVVELENSQDIKNVAYSLWKVLCVRCELRIVFCYCRDSGERSQVIKFLKDEVIAALQLPIRAQLEGDTIVVVGSRSDSETFPYGFFKWWCLEKNTGILRIV